MNTIKFPYDNQERSQDDDELDTDMDTKGEKEENGAAEHAPVSAGTRSMTLREEQARAPPGPSSAKERYRARSRSGSVSSGSSRASDASAAMAAERKSRREQAQKKNRQALARARERAKRTEAPIIVIASESEGAVEEEERGSPIREDPSRKRKMAADEEGESDMSDETRKKQGRPSRTECYISRAKALEERNQKMREAAALDNERILKTMSSGQVFSKLESDLERAMDDLGEAPTADLASRARECMAEVIKVAKGSRNLQGGYIRILKNAAVIGSATAEILRTRADAISGTDSPDVPVQLRELRSELERVKREARVAREEAVKANTEADRLRKELVEVMRRTRGRRRTFIRDSSASPSPDRGEAAPKDGEPATTSSAQAEEVAPMEMEVEEMPEDASKDREYCDVRRKKELLPPGETWPEVWRPPLGGKAVILEDRMLDGHRVRMIRKEESPNVAPPTPRDNVDKSAQALLKQLAPLLEGWLRTSLEAIGLQIPEKGKGPGNPPARTKAKGGKGDGGPKGNPNPPSRQAAGSGKARKGLEATTIPNKTLWSEVASGVAGARVASLPATNRGDSKPEKINTAPTASAEPWREVGKRGKPKGNTPAAGRPLAGAGQEGKPPTIKNGGKPGKGIPGGKAQATTKRRPPRTAAVTLTCPPDRYAEAMRVVREQISLRELGIDALRPKRAATGALVLEISGPNGAERAVALRDKMAEALKNMEGARVARPVKKADLRIRDLTEAATTAEIKEALASLGGCAVEEVRTGDIKMSNRGLGTLWAQCPLVAANRIMAVGRVNLGWLSSRVEILETRQMQCYRCLQRGHIQSGCPNPVSRGSLCYRCSQPGHTAKACTNEPHCVLCQEQGIAAAHRIGGAACKAPKISAGPGGSGRGHKVLQRKTEAAPQPAVRGGPLHVVGAGAPVPVRLGAVDNGEEEMEVEVEMEPALSPPPKEKRSPRKVTGREGPAEAPR